MLRRAPEKTYSRRTPGSSSTYGFAEPTAKRRRIGSNTIIKGSIEKELPPAYKDIASSPPSAPFEPEAAVLTNALNDNGVTPPSSPPSESQLPSRKPRRCAFSLLKRRHDAKHTASIADQAPLREITNLQQPTTQKPSKIKHGRPQRLTQMTIDLGQQMQKCCRTCGMEYVLSSEEDVALHAAYHSMNVGGVDLGRGTLRALAAKKLCSTDKSVANDMKKKESAAGWVAVVDCKSSVAEKKAVSKVLEVVNRELSAVGLEDQTLWSQTRIPETKTETQDSASTAQSTRSDSDNNGQTPRFRAYLYLRDAKCVGLCLAERISGAFEVLENTTATDERVESRVIFSRSSSISIAKKQEPAALGVSRIWTSNHHRRQGNCLCALGMCAGQLRLRHQYPKIDDGIQSTDS